jgi:hypothetical protein
MSNKWKKQIIVKEFNDGQVKVTGYIYKEGSRVKWWYSTNNAGEWPEHYLQPFKCLRSWYDSRYIWNSPAEAIRRVNDFLDERIAKKERHSITTNYTHMSEQKEDVFELPDHLKNRFIKVSATESVNKSAADKPHKEYKSPKSEDPFTGINAGLPVGYDRATYNMTLLGEQ